MDTVVVSCRTLETELTKAMENTQMSYPVFYVESGLHNWPDKLNVRLAELLDPIRADRVLLAMGFCGNSVKGLRAGNWELIIPRADDCITLLLGSHRRREQIARDCSAYFLTEGWMRGERNLWVEYLYSVEKYGEKTARRIAKMMYSHYRTLALLDTGAESVEPLAEKTKIIADTLQLEQKVVPATLAFLEDLLTGPWDDGARFLRKEPGSVVTAEDLFLV